MNKEFNSVLCEITQSKAIEQGHLDAASEDIVDCLIRGLCISRVGIWLFNSDKQTLISCLLQDGTQRLTGQRLTLSDYPRCFSSLEHQGTVTVYRDEGDLVGSELLAQYLIPNDITALIMSPICHRGEVVGVLTCEHKGSLRRWTGEEALFVSALAGLYGRAIHANASLAAQEKLQTHNTDLTAEVDTLTHTLNEALGNLQVTQSNLMESEKMAALGRLVAGVAHEVNTPLGIAVTSVSHCIDELHLIKKRFSSNELAEEDFVLFMDTLSDGLQLIDRNLSRAAELVHNFKRTAADQLTLEKERFNLSYYLHQISSPLRPLTRKHNIQMEICIKEDIFVESYPGAIAQIFTNLVSNCFRHAYPASFVGNKCIELGAERCGNEINMYYKDNGQGLSDAVKERVFEPFFTTARQEGGTGLGMSIVHNLVTKTLGGRIELHSKEGEGLDVNIFIAATE